MLLVDAALLVPLCPDVHMHPDADAEAVCEGPVGGTLASSTGLCWRDYQQELTALALHQLPCWPSVNTANLAIIGLPATQATQVMLACAVMHIGRLTPQMQGRNKASVS